MIPALRIVLPALVIVGVLVLVLPGGPLSLATDVGLDDETVCDAVAATPGQSAVERLEATGFPHASADAREVYDLRKDGTREAIVLINWDSQTAACLPLDYKGPVTATAELDARAYGVLTSEIRHVLETGTLSGHTWGNRWALVWGTSIDLPQNPTGEWNYRLTLAKWTAGRLVAAGDGGAA